MQRLLLLLSCWCWCSALSCAAATLSLDVDFASFLARSDPTWSWSTTKAPGADAGRASEWVSSLFGGNGDHGFQLWAPTPSMLQLDVSRQTLWDDRTPDLGPEFYSSNFVLDQPRLPTGSFHITWEAAGAVNETPALQFAGRVSLYSARATLNATTLDGSAGFTVAAWCNAEYGKADVIVVETSTFGNMFKLVVQFVPALAASTWANKEPQYVYNPPPINSSTVFGGGVLNVTTQPHLPAKGTAHATAVLHVNGQGLGTASSSQFFILSISPVLESPTAANAACVEQVVAATNSSTTPRSSLAKLRGLHESWWSKFWPAGGVLTLDNSPMEAFWYTQLFKFASGTRAGRSVHDLQGPWFIAGTPWPDLHWDMNLEQTYYFPMEANHPELASTLGIYMESLLNSGNLQTNVPLAWQDDSAGAPTGASSLSGNETCYWDYGANCTTAPPSVTGNLLWTISVMHRAAEFSGNTTMLTDVVCPLLDLALQAYQHFQVDNATGDGKIHLPETFSPEYPGPRGTDANYDVSLYRWGLATAIDMAVKYPDAPRCGGSHQLAWEDTLERLTWFPVDNVTGTLEIYAGVPYAIPHRHYSHLFSIWPLHLLNLTDDRSYELARQSINLWLETPEKDSMFYRPAASAMNVLLGQRAAAFDNISYLIDNRIEGSTWYREGQQGSCTETPYAGAWAMINWMIQSWNVTNAGSLPNQTVIDFFPGVDDIVRIDRSSYEAAPSRLARTQFWRMGTRGGFSASARRELVSLNDTHIESRTAFIAIEAPGNRGSTSVVVRTNMLRPLQTSVTTEMDVSIREIGDGDLVEIFGLAPAATIILFSAAHPIPDFSIAPLAGCPADFNHWGSPQVAPSPAPVPGLVTCKNYTSSGIVCSGPSCFRCHDHVCSTDEAPNPPNCGANALAEPVLATPCTVGTLTQCAKAAAQACSETGGCNSFSLDPTQWSSAKAKLWNNNGSGLVRNDGWSTWVRISPPSPAPPAPAPSPSRWPCL